MFQFPRKFPQLVDSAVASETAEAIKKEAAEAPPGGAAPRGKTPPDWGRFGPRANRSARWPTEQGQMGELCIHKSGKVSLRVNGDLQYEILPAAQPSFLQELAIIDHDPATEPVSAAVQADPNAEQPESKPSGAMVMVGQTSKKFIVVPDAAHLLEKIGEQEHQEKEAELLAKQLKRQAKLEQH